jgi:hypothetical protein
MGIREKHCRSRSPSSIPPSWLTVTSGPESGRDVLATVIVNGRHVYLPLAMRE